ncbi:MAG TPA: Hsp20 family protein [Clostridia bacterium]|nr:Hsp20 family protein [Clostridia bacterium]
MRNYLSARNFFDDAFDSFFRPVFFDAEDMRTDIRELDDRYEMAIEMPGFDKNEINIELANGYLNISARKEEKEEDKKNKYIFRERKVAYKRSYYVGDAREENIRARYEDGVLYVDIPKKNEQVKGSNRILIE